MNTAAFNFMVDFKRSAFERDAGRNSVFTHTIGGLP
jgi:hypothetical protein